MAKYFVLLVALVAVHGNSVNRVGWGPPPPPTTTPAPTTTAPPETEAPTTPGWSAPPPPPPPSGWSPPPPPPSSSVSIDLSAELAAVGAGTAAESHAENISATGGWGVPADVLVSSGGDSVVAQDGSIIQVTSVDAESASSLNAASVDQVAAADEGLAVIASGLDVAVGQAGWAGATGAGASAVAADTSILVNA